jgi:hypothetical protein
MAVLGFGRSSSVLGPRCSLPLGERNKESDRKLILPWPRKWPVASFAVDLCLKQSESSQHSSVFPAHGLKPYVRSEVYEAQRLALDALGKCGPAAVETIRGMLNDPAFGDQAAELVKALVQAGGETVGEELNSRLQQELAFWQARAPSLSQGWWNQDPAPHAPLREKYSQTFQLILGLQRTHYTPALITAKNLGNLWRSLPQLNDPSGLNQMAEECDKLVEHLRAN